jgi:hypothetical protein
VQSEQFPSNAPRAPHTFDRFRNVVNRAE